MTTEHLLPYSYFFTPRTSQEIFAGVYSYFHEYKGDLDIKEPVESILYELIPECRDICKTMWCTAYPQDEEMTFFIRIFKGKHTFRSTRATVDCNIVEIASYHRGPGFWFNYLRNLLVLSLSKIYPDLMYELEESPLKTLSLTISDESEETMLDKLKNEVGLGYIQPEQQGWSGYSEASLIKVLEQAKKDTFSNYSDTAFEGLRTISFLFSKPEHCKIVLEHKPDVPWHIPLKLKLIGCLFNPFQEKLEPKELYCGLVGLLRMYNTMRDNLDREALVFFSNTLTGNQLVMDFIKNFSDSKYNSCINKHMRELKVLVDWAKRIPE